MGTPSFLFSFFQQNFRLFFAETKDEKPVFQTYLWLELESLPDEFDLLPAVVLLHHGEAEGERSHPQAPSPET